MECRHATLVLVEVELKRRCRHCALVLSSKELGDSFCPECFEETGQRNYDFDDVKEAARGKPLYFCEDCGAGVGGEPASRPVA